MPRELTPGTMIAEYEIKRTLGHGGFGITYLAYDETLARNVAIKEYFPREFAHRESGSTVVPSQGEQERADFEWGMKYFVEEARSLTRFKHKNIIGAIRFVRANGTAYLVMEYCDGESLEALVKRNGSLPEHVLSPIVSQLLDGLEEVHRVRLLHLDIKPSNIFLKKDGTVVLLDFGSVRQAISSQTKSVMVGSPGYAAPEQASDDIDSRSRGPWTDVYGLGATLYRLVSGVRPQEATARLLEDRLMKLSSSEFPGYSANFLEAVNAALRLGPQERPQSVAEFRVIATRSDALRSVVPETSSALMDESYVGQKKFNWWLPALGISALLLVIVVLKSNRERSVRVDTAVLVEAPSIEIPVASDETPTTGPSIVAPATEAGPAPCPPDQGLEEFEAGTITWDDCFGVITKGAYKFSGIWRAGQKYEGSEVYADAESLGDRYVGRFKDNLRHGQGKYVYADGSTYEGAWKSGKAHGRGTFTMKEGLRFTGEWIDGVENGPGSIRFSDGDRFDGNFVDGKKSGMGTYTFKSGDKFVGMFSDGSKNGVGTYTFADGDKFVGNYVNDKRSGLGTYTYKNGKKFVGMYVDDKRSGPGAEYDAAGNVLVAGNWRNGEFVGDVSENNDLSQSSAKSARNLYLDVKNSTPHVIRYIYLKPRGADSWGDDRLGQRVLMVNETYRIQIPSSAQTIFDLRLCDDDRDEYIIYSVNVEISDAEVKLGSLTREKCS